MVSISDPFEIFGLIRKPLVGGQNLEVRNDFPSAGLQVWHVGRGIQGFTIATLGIQGIHRFSVFDQKNNMFWRDSGIQRRDSEGFRDSH